MATLDFGCAMGFFSLPLAKLVGREGTVLCVDCQPFMLDRLMRRARRAKLDHVIEPRLADRADFGLATERSRFDLALAIAVAHEVPDQRALFAALHASLRPDGGLLFCEPAGHVTRDSFETELGVARDVGFGLARRLDLRRTHTAVLRKLA
jgi:SAM-dependent methyltransferase